MIRKYISDLKKEFKDYNSKKIGLDFMAGMTVAAVALPLALAFGVSSGADAAAGLITAIISGIVITLFSGASFQISGPTGAMTAILISIVAQYKLQGVFIATMMAGALLIILGIFKFGKLVGYIPAPVITGFTSGIAIVIALGQIDNFFGVTSSGSNCIQKFLSYFNNGFNVDIQTMLIGILVVAIMVFYPKKLNAIFPSSLASIIVATAITIIMGLDITAVGAIPKTLFPQNRLQISDISFDMIKNLLAPAVSIAALGMIESLLCGSAAGRMKNEKLDADRELIAQGIGNMLIPFFGGVPATAAIARTSVAIKSGCQTRITGIFHSFGLLASMLILGSIMSKIPLSALAGVLMVTSYRMNDWNSITKMFKNKFKVAILKFTITMLATIVFDLTSAIIIGVVLAIFAFAMNSAKLSINTSKVDANRLNTDNATAIKISQNHANTLIVYVTGSIFFANSEYLISEVTKHTQYDKIIFSMRGVPLIDTSAIQALEDLYFNAKSSDMDFYFTGLQPKVKELLNRSGFEETIGSSHIYKNVEVALSEIAEKETQKI